MYRPRRSTPARGGWVGCSHACGAGRLRWRGPSSCRTPRTRPDRTSQLGAPAELADRVVLLDRFAVELLGKATGRPPDRDRGGGDVALRDIEQFLDFVLEVAQQRRKSTTQTDVAQTQQEVLDRGIDRATADDRESAGV